MFVLRVGAGGVGPWKGSEDGELVKRRKRARPAGRSGAKFLRNTADSLV